uniref:response regulator n=1 Tax=Eubacterium cellulosolvens TaxID=29322 RepID=UPI001FA71619|nr:response regulator [[Eubacterium] cellulosolvens]
MFEFLRSAQLNVMFSLSSICGIITLFVLITGSLSRKRKTALILIEISAMLLLVFDRYAYIYRGDVSELGWWMVRICNFSVFALTVFIIFAFNLYLSDLMTCEGGLTTTPKRLKAVYVIAGIGELFVVANLFTGIYYTFDSTNRYSRSDGVVISFAIPILALLLQLSVIKSYGKKLSRIVRISLLLFTLVPLAVSILQFFIYGLSLTNISIVGMAILLYIFVLLDLNAAKEAKEEAEYENRAKSHFLANMSHEIRTPINAVLGMNEMILRESENPEIQAYADRIKLAGNTLLGLVNDILDFSKIEAGKMEILPVDYDVSSLLNDLVNMIQSRAEDKGLLLIPDFVETMPKILYGDEVRIKQIIMNILTNAVKYTEKGSITFHVGYERIEDEPENVYLNVSVTDTGIGIRPEDVEKLFHEFERIEEKRNRNIEGTGLGMNITRSLLEMMGSRLEVFSVYGEGSKFSFRLKQRVVSWEVLGDYEVSYRAAIAGRKKSKEKFTAPDAEILVTDDTAMNLEVFKNLLKRTCVQIDTASGGDECLSLTREKKYDVIFLDHMMPKKNGIETLRELRAQNDNPNRKTCVICLTANALSGAREHYLEAGFDDYLTKPIDVERLEDTLMRYLPQDKLQPPLEETAVPAPSWFSNKATILIADDDPVICMLAARILGGNFQVSTCDNGAKTQEKAAELKPDLILLDINLGDMSGFDVLRKLRERPETSEIPVMFITGASDRDAEIRGFRGGASDFVRKPFVPEVLLQRAQRIIALDHLQRNLRSEVRHQTLRAEHLTREMMLALSKAVDAKDHYTSGHSERVAAYSAEIARRMGKSPAEQERIYEMGLLHDIGKIGVPEELINKTSKLPESEFERIKRHTVTGSEILSFITEMPELAMGARSHHERYDGTGYPDGLKGENIPEAARIICLADCYDAMTSTRTYSKPGEQADVRAEIVRCAGTQFDPDIAKVLLAMIDEDKDYVMTERTADIHIWQGSDRLWTFTEEQAEGLHSTEGETGKINEAAGLASPEGSDRSGQDGENTALRADADISSSNPEDEQRAMEKLRQLKEISIEDGLRYCGTVENYLDTLQIYTENAPASADEIEHLWSEGSLADTTVKVHAIKSMSRCIGAERIGELAEKLELAGKAGDAEEVGAGIGGLLARIRKLCEELQEV